jgi:4-amino-4-deoxy-L-arabinose transferase-like glycosyltransferase
VPRAAWICAAIAFLNAFTWSIIIPPFQGRDEVDHFAYVEQLAETGTLPHGGDASGPGAYSPEEALVMHGLHYWQVRFTPYMPSLSSVAEQQTLMRDVHAGASLVGPGGAGGASSEPPLYYALEAVPYILGGNNVLTKLQLMRLLGTLLAAATALLVYLFLGELLPGSRWAATVGAVCAALQPQFAFSSASVNPDAMIFTVSAAVFLCLAHAFRRGLTKRLAISLGLLIATGLVTYLSFIGVAVGAFVALAVLAVRETRSRRWRSILAPALAAGIGAAPALLYALRNTVSNRPTFGLASSIASLAATKSLLSRLSYIWELYLPRLPGMPHYFQGIVTWRDIWFDRSVGLYGWMDTMFPTWVDSVALVIVGAIALLCGRELLARRSAMRASLSEFGSYAAIGVGVLVTLGVASYSTDVIEHEMAFGEPRYLLSLLALLAALIALAVRGAGRRWSPVVGAAMVALFLGHDIFSQLQVVARYYG